jgi:hypothetical protein
LSHQHLIRVCPCFSQMAEMGADLLNIHLNIFADRCFLRCFFFGFMNAQTKACAVSTEGEPALLTRPMRLAPRCKSPILQHYPRSVSLTVRCPRVLQASDYSIGPEVGDVHPPERRTMSC